MSLIVMKFGGSSVSNIDKIKIVTAKIINKKKTDKNKVVVVVSAPGDMTDELIDLANQITDKPDDREMDMLLATGEQRSVALLSMSLKANDYDAISLTGPQAGIHADMTHTKARITVIKPSKIFKELNKNKIVIVAGFQGINPNKDVTTLGRGGSDLTAVAIAAAIKADICEIYTDVDGVYTTDPRVCSRARKINCISYDEMLEMSGSGAQVMQARSIEVAKKYNVIIEVKSSFNNNPGTIINDGKKEKKMENVVITAVTFDKNQSKLSILEVNDKPGIAAKVFGILAKSQVNVDMIIQSSARERYNDISFTVSRNDLKKTVSVLSGISRELNSKGIIFDDKIAKLSIVGVGMKSHPGVAAKMFNALAKEKINIEMISTSEIKISCVIKEESVNKAVNALHRAFGLNK